MRRFLSLTLVFMLICTLSFVGAYASSVDEKDFSTEMVFGVMEDDYVGSFMLFPPNTVERDYTSAFYFPMCGMTVTMDDKLLVADTQYGRIHVYDSNMSHQDSFGSLGYGDGKLNYPVDIAEDDEGNLYIADFFNMYVAKFSASGEFLGRFGSEGDENGQFIGPGGVAVDSDGYIYVSDCTTGRVQKFDSSFNFVKLFNSGDGEIAPLSSPGAIRIGSNGNVYVAEMSNGQIYIFGKDGDYIRPALKKGDESISKCGVFEISDSGKFYVHDRAPASKIVRIFDASGNFESSFQNVFDGEVMSDGFALANDGTMFLHSYGTPVPGADFNPESPFICGNSMELVHVNEDGKKIGSPEVFNPKEYGRAGDMTDCAVSQSGKVYGLSSNIVDSSMINESRVFVWDQDGDLLDVLSPDDFELSSNAILTSIALDSFDNVFIGALDENIGKIIKLDIESDKITEIGTDFVGSPESMAVDKMDNVYVADSVRSSVLVFTNTGRFRNEFKFNFSPRSVDVDEFRNVCVSAENQVVVINRKGREIAVFGGQGRRKGSVYYPEGIAFTASGDIIVSDTENCRLQIFSKSEGSSYDFNTSSQRMLGLCKGIVWGNDNMLYVADGFHGVVHKVSIDGQAAPSTGEGEGSEPPVPPEPPENETILSDGEILFNPENVKIQSGSIAEIDIKIDFASNVFGLGMTVKYDTSFLKLEDCKPGDFLSSDGNENLFHYTDSPPGTINIAGPTRTGVAGGMNGTGTLVKLKFSGVNEGDTVIELEDVIVKDPHLNNIQVVTKPCDVEVMAMDAQPPEIKVDIPACSYSTDFVLEGKTERGAKLQIEINGKKSDISVKSDGSFSYKMTLGNGDNKFKLIATDNAGNKFDEEYSINLRPRNIIVMWVGKSDYIFGSKSDKFEVPPQIIDGSTYVPLRALGDLLGCDTQWFGDERKVVYTYVDPCSSSKTVLEIWIGKQVGKKNGQTWDMGKAPQIVNGRSLVPLRAISEGLGADVGWEGATKKITITHPKQ